MPSRSHQVLLVIVVCLGIASIAVVALLHRYDKVVRLCRSTLPMLGADPQHSGSIGASGPKREPIVLRELRPGVSGGECALEPAIDENGRVYMGCGARSGGEHLVCYNGSGEERWRFSSSKAFRYGLSAPLLL